jgi:hypothetical protein
MVKKYTSLLLVAMLVIHLTGFYVYFIVRLGEIRMSMREQLALLPADQLDMVLVPRTAFRASWLEEREMQWNGNMYDIARVETVGDFVTVYCKQDKDEENLLSFLTAVVEMTSEDSRPTPDSVTQFLSLKFVVVDITCPPMVATIIDWPQRPYPFQIIQVSLIPTTPPPQG